MVPEPLTVAVVELEDGFAIVTLPLACHWLNLYPLGIFPVEREYMPAGLITEPP